jgi:ComF family protein
MTFYTVKRFLLNIVYPNRCPFCKKVIAFNQYYCCLGELELVNQACGGSFALFEYTEASMSFVYAIKDSGDGYAISAAAKLISELVCDRIPEGVDLITAIPTDKGRMRERGYNPPALIALQVSEILKAPCDLKLLTKNRRTEVQKFLSEAERRENVKDAFSGKECSGTVLLIDDVCTTGATLHEATKVLTAAGAWKVFTAVVATASKWD